MSFTVQTCFSLREYPPPTTHSTYTYYFTTGVSSEVNERSRKLNKTQDYAWEKTPRVNERSRKLNKTQDYAWEKTPRVNSAPQHSFKLDSRCLITHYTGHRAFNLPPRG